MASLSARIKNFAKTSRWMYPVRWLWILIWLPRYVTQARAGNSAVLQPEFPYTHIRKADEFLKRAEKRLGKSAASLSSVEKKKHFYTYFSEIGDDNYEGNIRQQHEAYLPIIKAAGPGPFLDIGCGAGEFINFLKKHGVAVLGVDMEASEVVRARARGLDVAQGDALEYLRGTDKKFGGISMIQVVEHVPFDQIGDIFEAAHNKLADNGIFIVETVNIRQPMAIDSFYCDPTHQRPVPEDYVVFMMEWYGFKNLQVVYTNPMKLPGVDAHDVRRIYCTYAVIGRR